MNDKCDAQLDLSSIPLPSDQITFGSQRRRHPEIFGGSDWYTRGSIADIDVVAVFGLEKACALKAFAKAMGKPDPVPEWTRSEIIADLHDAYVEYGISQGGKSTLALVQKIENLAASQAAKLR